MNRLGSRAARPRPAPSTSFAPGRSPSARYTDVPHRVFTTPRQVVFREMEYAVPREAGLAALREVRRAIEASDWRIGFPVEIRFVPGRRRAALHRRRPRHASTSPCTRTSASTTAPTSRGVEPILRDHGGRPHWGKLHTLAAEDLAPSYPRFADFLAMRDRLDPDRVFANAYLRRVLGE